ncbi:MAG: hypothetical protein WCL18_09825 [bacterium]
MVFSSLLYTYKSLGTEIIVTAHNFGLNDATIIESARYHPACHCPPNPTIIMLIFQNSSLIISSPIAVDTTFTVDLPIYPPSICAHCITYFPTKNTRTIQKRIINILATPANHENGVCEL